MIATVNSPSIAFAVGSVVQLQQLSGGLSALSENGSAANFKSIGYQMAGNASWASAVQNSGQLPLDDKDVSRLEDRISASEERGQLRLEAAINKVEATLARIADQNVSLMTEMRNSRAANSAWGQWIIGTILVVALAVLGLNVGLKQLLVGGIQIGQALQGSQSVTPPRTP